MLTTLAKVKARLGIQDSDVKDDDLLTSFIGLITGRFEIECNRTFGYGQTTEEFHADEMELRVARYPIDTAQAISFQLLTRSADGWQAITPAPNYIIRQNCVISLESQTGASRAQLRVNYYGGYLLPDGTTAGTVALPNEVEQAAIEQVVYQYQNKDRLGVGSVSGQGGAITNTGKLDLLAHVQAVLSRYVRYMP